MAINTRSPHFESIDFAAMSYAKIQIYIWTGSKFNAAPNAAEYTLRKSAITPESGNPIVSFETSELIRDFLDTAFDGDYNGQGVWVKHVLTAYNSSDVVLFSKQNIQIAFDSYSYFEETYNRDSPIMVTNRKLFVLEDNTFRVPIYTDLNPNTLFIKDNQVVFNQTFNESLESSEQIKYVSIYGDDDNWDTFKERILGDSNNSVFESSKCLNNFFNEFSIGAVDEVRVSYESYGSELMPSIDLLSSSWFHGGNVTEDTVITGGQLSPAYDSLAYRVTSPSGNSGYASTIGIQETTDGSDFTIYVWLKGSGSVQIKLQELGDDYTNYFSKTITLTSSWNKYDVTGAKDEDGNPSRVVINSVGSAALDVYVYEPSIKEFYGVKTDVINVETLQECKYEPKKVTFLNKFGALQDMYFFKKSVERMNVEKESYKSNILSGSTYDRSNHVYRDFNLVGKESVTLSSGFLSEEYNEVFKQMMLSEKVWITNITEDGEQVLPINVKTSDITYKTSLNDKLVEYTIEFDKSFDTINNIR
jgi:hypothetical protein